MEYVTDVTGKAILNEFAYGPRGMFEYLIPLYLELPLVATELTLDNITHAKSVVAVYKPIGKYHLDGEIYEYTGIRIND